MKIYSLIIFAIYCIYRYTSIKIKLEIKKNILKFGYGIDFKYEGMLAHSFDRFYVVTKFILLSIKDLKFSKLNYDGTCTYLNDKNIGTAENKNYILDFLAYCKKIRPYVDCFKRQINSYNNLVCHILKNKIDLILPWFSTKQKWGIIASLVSGSIGLAYEGIFSFRYNKRHKGLQKAVKALDCQSITQCNKLMHLKNSRVIYGIYNADTRETHKHCTSHSQCYNSIWEPFTGKQDTGLFHPIYINMQGIQHCPINSLLYLRIIKGKYFLIYKELITQLYI